MDKLKNGERANALVLVNRYDGIDLPDEACRILFFDSKPYAETLIDRYAESCRPGSEVIAARTARTIEQGLGRSVRGEKDYSVIVVIGPELVKAFRTKSFQKHLSGQTRSQVAIGMEIAELVKKRFSRGKPPDALHRLIQQCLKRDPIWKEFYADRMKAVTAKGGEGKALDIFEKEFQAEIAQLQGRPDEARKILQDLIDTSIADDTDRGWYLQEIARMLYTKSKTESEKYQLAAHRKNRALMKPPRGVEIERIVCESASMRKHQGLAAQSRKPRGVETRY